MVTQPAACFRHFPRIELSVESIEFANGVWTPLATKGDARPPLDSPPIWQWFPDAGNGIRASGAYVTGNDTNDANVASNSTFQQGWAEHLVNRWGTNANAGNETGFKIERCAGASCGNFVQIATVGANVKNYSNPALKRNTSYRYRVRAYNGSGDSAYSNLASAKTPR